MQDIRICDNCGACYLNNGEHECDVKPDRESDDWYIDQHDVGYALTHKHIKGNAK